jgi:ArsR family transcriptional regulator
MGDLATIAAALGDPLRVRILQILATGRHGPCCSPANPEAPVAVCACDIATDLGGLAPSKLAYHLSRLRSVGLVHEQRRGKWVYYSINQEALAAFARIVTNCCSHPATTESRGSATKARRRPGARGTRLR